MFLREVENGRVYGAAMKWNCRGLLCHSTLFLILSSLRIEWNGGDQNIHVILAMPGSMEHRQSVEAEIEHEAERYETNTSLLARAEMDIGYCVAESR